MSHARITFPRALFLTAIGLASPVPAAVGQAADDREHDPGLAGLRASIAASAPAVFTGRVCLPNGEPASGAVIVTSAGGESVTAADGRFELEVEVPLDAGSVQVTAVASGGAQSLVASARVELLAPGRAAPLDRLILAAGTSCQPSWIPTFGGMPGANDYVLALTVFDDGSGPALYAGGAFTIAGGVAASSVARWDGTSWSALGSGVSAAFSFDPTVNALTVFDDGGGPALYAGGNFTTAGGVAANGIAKWDGTGWSALGSGMNHYVKTLTVFDDGSGPALYAGGQFTTAGGVAANHIAKWDGTSWSTLSSGMNSDVIALMAFDDGGGPALYAGGAFWIAGGVAALRVAKWNGTSWSALGSGMNTSVNALTVFDDGSGPALYAGGNFWIAGGVAANRIAKWNGTSWSALGSGMNDLVFALTEFDDGSGPALYAGGTFTSAGGVAANRMAKWNGASWSALGSGMSGDTYPFVDALTEFDDGSGPALFAVGRFTSTDGFAALHAAKWNGTSWSALGSGMHDYVLALTEFDDGTGSELYAGGSFTSAGSVAANHIAKWDGTSWSALGSGMEGGTFGITGVLALAEFDDGSGPALFAGGTFTSAGGVAASHVAKWDGASWSALGSGMSSSVRTLAVFDDGSGPALYAGGQFTTAGGVAANRIAKWDGTSWSALGSGMSSSVATLAVFDDGSGPALYAGGEFLSAGGVAAYCVAKWNGTSWSALGSGMYISVDALAVFDDGSGPALYAGGLFTSAGGVAASCIAKWDGTSWSALSSGLNDWVQDLTVFDDGSGRALYAGGYFTSAGGVAASRIAKWDGTSWSALGSEMDDGVLAMTGFDDGSGPALYAGGVFLTSPAGDSFLAKWGCPVPPITSLPGCAGNPAMLEALATSAPLGAPLPLRITASAALSGLGVVAYGASGIDGSGCGLVVPGIGELLLALAPLPKTLPSGLLAGGICDLSPLVPSSPTLSGVVAYLQGAAADFMLPQPFELTNALAVQLGP